MAQFHGDMTINEFFGQVFEEMEKTGDASYVFRIQDQTGAVGTFVIQRMPDETTPKQ